MQKSKVHPYFTNRFEAKSIARAVDSENVKKGKSVYVVNNELYNQEFVDIN